MSRRWIGLFVLGALALGAGFALNTGEQGRPAAAQSLYRLTLPIVSYDEVRVITFVVLALDSRGDLYEPVEPTTVFGLQETIHAVVTVRRAPHRAVVRATWIAEDTGVALPRETFIATQEWIAFGNQVWDFRLAPETSWAPGLYRLELRLNGIIERVVPYTVAREATVIRTVTFARGRLESDRLPPSPPPRFAPQTTIYVVAGVTDVQPGTLIKGELVAENVDGPVPVGTRLAGSVQRPSGAGTVVLGFPPPPDSGDWLPGRYRVDIFVNGVLVRSVPCFVAKALSSLPSS